MQVANKESTTVSETVYPVYQQIEIPNTDGKLFKTVIARGTEGTKPPSGAKVTVHYIGTLESSGTEFGNSRKRHDPSVFTIGEGKVIKGLEAGVLTMNVGERAILKCLPEYGYGEAGCPPTIPANSTLLFDIELIDWSITEDISDKNRVGSIVKTIKKGAIAGESDQPGYESSVHVSMTAHDDDGGLVEYLREHNLPFRLGEGDIPTWFENVLKTFKRGEEAQVKVSPEVIKEHQENIESGKASSDKMSEKLPKDPKKPIVYNVAVHNFDVVDDKKYKGDEKIKEGQKRVDEGKSLSLSSFFDRAEQKFRRALDFFDDVDFDEMQRREAQRRAAIAHSNLAQLLMDTSRFDEALEACNRSLAMEAANIDSLFRRGRLFRMMDEFDKARQDILNLLNIDSAHTEAKKELEKINESQKTDGKKTENCDRKNANNKEKK